VTSHVEARRLDLSARRMPIAAGVAVALALVGAGAVTLWLMGQPALCKCGVVALWSGNIDSNQNSQQVADPYTFTHVTHGLLFFFALLPLARWLALSWRLVAAALIEVSWEGAENTDAVINRYREATISLDYFGDSVLNSSFDALFCLVGFAIATRLPWRASVALIAVSEGVLALTIRDSLLLNIVMLLYPVEAVRQWQLGR